MKSYLFCALTIVLLVGYSHCQDPISSPWSAEEIVDVADLHCVTILLPKSIEKGVSISGVWILPGGEVVSDIGLSFEGVPGGSQVKLVWWWDSVALPSIKFRYRYADSSGMIQHVLGEICAPEGFGEIYGYAKNFSEVTTEEGGLIYLYRRETDHVCSLHFSRVQSK